MSIPADNVLHLRVDNLTHDWEKYALTFNAKSPGPMVRPIALFQP